MSVWQGGGRRDEEAQRALHPLLLRLFLTLPAAIGIARRQAALLLTTLLQIRISSLLAIASTCLATLGIALRRRTARLAGIGRLQVARVGEVGRSDAAVAAAVVEIASASGLAGA